MRSDKVQNLASAAVMTSNVTSSSQPLQQIFGYAIAAVITSSAAVSGTLKLQASIDNSNFADIVGSSQTIITTGTFFYNVTDVMYPYVRAVWTDGGSDASARMTIQCYVKGI